MRDGQPGVVRDLRADVDSIVLRLAPVGAVDSFDLSVSWLILERLWQPKFDDPLIQRCVCLCC